MPLHYIVKYQCSKLH